MISKMHAMLLSVFTLFMFRFDATLTHISVDFIKSWVVASIPEFFVCMWCAAKIHCVAYNVLGISSCIQGGSFQTGATFLPLFPTADAPLPSRMFSIGDTVSGICVALALCIAVLRGSTNRFSNCTLLRNTVSLTVAIIIMNWFQAAQPAQYVASVVIGFVAVQCLWNGVVNQSRNQLMGKVWDGGLDDATALPEDRGDGPEDGSSNGWYYGDDPEDGSSNGCYHGPEDGSSNGWDHGHDPEDGSSNGCYHGDGPEDGSSNGWDHGDDPDGDGPSSGSDEDTFTLGPRAVQLLSVRANFPIRTINVFDWRKYMCIYMAEEGEVQQEGMHDLVLTGPTMILEAKGCIGFEIIPADDTSVIEEVWSVVMKDDQIDEYTLTIDGGLGRTLDVTYLLMPDAIETHIQVKLNLKDLESRSRTVYGSIKASAIDYGSNGVHLFSCDRGRSLSFPCGSTCNLPLSPRVIAVPFRRHFKLHIKVDLRVITTYDSQEGSQEEGKKLEFCLDFTRRVTRQEREVDGDKIETNVTWYLDNMCT